MRSMNVTHDAKRAADIVGKYNGIASAHIMGVCEKEKREFSIGGNAQMVAGLLLELLTMYTLQITSEENREAFSRDFMNIYAQAVLNMRDAPGADQ